MKWFCCGSCMTSHLQLQLEQLKTREKLRLKMKQEITTNHTHTAAPRNSKNKKNLHVCTKNLSLIHWIWTSVRKPFRRKWLCPLSPGSSGSSVVITTSSALPFCVLVTLTLQHVMMTSSMVVMDALTAAKSASCDIDSLLSDAILSDDVTVLVFEQVRGGSVT